MKIISAILGIALVIVGGAAIHFWREADAGRQQIAELQARLREQQSQPVASVAMPAAQPPVGAAPEMTSSRPAAATPPAQTAGQERTAIQATLDVMQAQASSPEQVAQRLKSQTRRQPACGGRLHDLASFRSIGVPRAIRRPRPDSRRAARSGASSGDAPVFATLFQD